jgi:aspartokinase-like uncharacterized kinase
MWVIKLGGSLARHRSLEPWLQMLAAYGGGRVAVVPGGAAFADTVRGAQAHWGFNGLAAHNMAVLAMAQTAYMLHALEPRLRLAANDIEIRQTLRAGQPALWLPYSVLRDAPDALTSWDVSSDSLALWLARRLHAERLVVVKACPVDATDSLDQLGRAGVLDVRFAEWAREADFPIEVLQHDHLDHVREGLVGGGGFEREDPSNPRVPGGDR